MIDLGDNPPSESGDFNVEVAALKSNAYIDFATGHVSEGRAGYKAALDIFSRYPGADNFTKLSTTVVTRLAWAEAEMNAGAHDAAAEQLSIADQAVLDWPESPGVAQLRANIASARATYGLPGPLAATSYASGPSK